MTAFAAGGPAVALTTPENSRLFVPYDDPVSKVRSYLLRPGLLGHNQQSLYFTAKSMTDDGRFLVFDVSDKEDFSEPTGGEVRFNTRFRRKGVVDFLRDEAYVLQDVPGAIPFLDRKTGRLYFADYEAVHCRNLAGDPSKDEIVCRVPDEFRCAYPDPEQRVCTHLTLSSDRKKAFLDIRRADGRSDPGTLDLTTGAFTRWAHFDFFANHGQFCPSDDGLAMVAREMAGNLTFDELTPEQRLAAKHLCPNLAPIMSDVRRPTTAKWPRVHLVKSDGSVREVFSEKAFYAYHECFTDDGRAIVFCTSGQGVEIVDLKTMRHENIPECRGSHAVLSPCRRFVAYDACVGGASWRGCPWQVCLFDRVARKTVVLWLRKNAYAPRACQSLLHPDPHPQFVCNGRYVVSTISREPGRMDLCVTPVSEQLFK